MNTIIIYDIAFVNRLNKNIKKLDKKICNTFNKTVELPIQNKMECSFFTRVPEKMDTEELKKSINLLLNKLSVGNVEIITEKIKKMMISEMISQFCIDCLFNKAISQHIYCELYTLLFKNIIDEKTKKYFIIILNEKLELLNKNISRNENSSTIYDDFCKFISDKKNFIGIYKFMENLYKNDLISKEMYIKYTDTIIININLNLTNDTKDVFVEALKTILENNKELYIRYRKDIKKYFMDNVNFKPRLKFMLMDIIDKYC